MTPEPSPLRAQPSMVLSAYVEPLVRGRRVALFGDATSSLGEQLAHRGARLVHVYDPEPTRVAEALARAGRARAAHVSYAVLADDLGVRDGAFDVVLIQDLSFFAAPEEVVRRSRRAVSPSGAVVIASPNPGAKKSLTGGRPVPHALDYYALFDLVALQFSLVRMAGQAPFVGYAVAEFAADGEPEVTVDTSLLDTTEEPEWFVAVGSERPVEIDRFAVIEIPLASLPEARRADDALDAVAHAELSARLSVVSLELERALEKQREDARDAAARSAASDALSVRLVQLEQDLEARDGRLRDAEARAGDAHVRAERLGHDLRDLDEELRRQRERAARLSKQLDDEKKARTRADVELGMIRTKPELTGARDRMGAVAVELEAARSRTGELESALRTAEQGRAVLQAQLEKATAQAAEPKRATFDAVARDAEAGLTRRIAELEAALRDAQREGLELAGQRFAARQRVKELEQALRDAELARDKQVGDLEQALREAHVARDQQVAALEQALRDTELASDKRATQQAKALEQDRRAAEVARDAAVQRGDRLERALRDAEAARDQATQRLKALEEGLGAAELARDELQARCASLGQKLAEQERSQTDAVHALEIEALEAALRERGQAVATLRRDLEESERIGRELVDELEELRAAAVAPGAPAASDEIQRLRTRLDTLATSAARCEADLQAAGWRVTELDRKLAEAEARAGAPPARAELELEQALVAAHQELAVLRKSLVREEQAALGAAHAVAEQSALLHQVAGSRGE